MVEGDFSMANDDPVDPKAKRLLKPKIRNLLYICYRWIDLNAVAYSGKLGFFADICVLQLQILDVRILDLPVFSPPCNLRFIFCLTATISRTYFSPTILINNWFII